MLMHKHMHDNVRTFREVATTVVDGDTDGESLVTGDTSSLELIKGETTALTDLGVVLVGAATDDRSQQLERTRGNSLGLGGAVVTTTELASLRTISTKDNSVYS